MQEKNLNKNKLVSKNAPLEGREVLGAVIYLIGYMASGKTTFGKKLANVLQYKFIDLDNLIEAKEKQTVAEIFATKGETYFREIEKQVLHTTINLQNVVISCGGGTPCFNNNIDFINENGFTIWMHTPIGFILERIKKESNQRPLVKDLNDEALQIKIENHFKERVPFYSQAKLEFNSKIMKEKDFITLVMEKIVK